MYIYRKICHFDNNLHMICSNSVFSIFSNNYWQNKQRKCTNLFVKTTHYRFHLSHLFPGPLHSILLHLLLLLHLLHLWFQALVEVLELLLLQTAALSNADVLPVCSQRPHQGLSFDLPSDHPWREQTSGNCPGRHDIKIINICSSNFTKTKVAWGKQCVFTYFKSNYAVHYC